MAGSHGIRALRPGMVIGVGTRVIPGAIVAAALLLTGCSSPGSLRTVDVQRQISEGLAKQVGGAFTVTCPATPPAEKGYTFTCTVVDTEGGKTVSVTVTEDDDAGAFSWRVDGTGSP